MGTRRWFTSCLKGGLSRGVTVGERMVPGTIFLSQGTCRLFSYSPSQHSSNAVFLLANRPSSSPLVARGMGIEDRYFSIGTVSNGVSGSSVYQLSVESSTLCVRDELV